MTSSPTPGSSDNIDVTGARVVVEWSKPDSQTSYLCSSDAESPEAGQISFDCHFRPSLNSASFRLRAPILIKGLGRKSTPLFVFIAPERIQSLSCHGTDQTPVSEVVRKALGNGDILSMRFGLSEPADLIVPQHSPLLPKKKIFWDTFDSLKMLVQETSFVIYLKRDDTLSQPALTSLCNAISARSVTTSTAHADISRLYDGKGGKVLRGADLAIPATAPLESPPSYDDAGPPPPAPPIEKEHSGSFGQDDSAGSSRKRRRTSSTGGDSGKSHAPGQEFNTDTTRVEAICRKLMTEMTAKWREEGDQLRVELRQMETRMKVWVEERLGKHVDDVREEIRRTTVEQQNQVDDQVQELRLELQEIREETQGVDDRIEDLKEEVEARREEAPDLVDGRLDERLESLRSELEEHVTDQLHEAENRVIDRLRSNVFIDFNIYE